MMVVRAAKDLNTGTEITFPYEAPDGTDSSKLEQKFKNWDFACSCAFCEDIKGTKASVILERQNLLDQLKRLCDSSSQAHNLPTKKMELSIKALDETYTRPAEEVPRLLLWDPQLLMTRIYMGRADYTKGLESVSKTLHVLGFIVTGVERTSADFEVTRWGYMMDHLVEVFSHARSAFEKLGAWKKSKQTEQYARLAYRVLVGENASFDRTHPRLS
jgi:hypothetical protein